MENKAKKRKKVLEKRGSLSRGRKDRECQLIEKIHSGKETDRPKEEMEN